LLTGVKNKPIDAFAISDARIVLMCVAAGFGIFYLLHLNALLALGALIIMGILALMLRWPEMGTLVVLIAIYSNIGVLAMRAQTAIQATAGSADQNPRIAIVLAAMSLLLFVPLVHQLLIRKEQVIFDHGFILMSAFFAALLTSSFFAGDGRIAGSRVADYLIEGLALYFLLTNVVRDFPTLRHATWSLLLAGSLMGGLTVYQRASHTEDKMYGGLAQMGVDVTLYASGRERSLRPVAEKSESDLRAAGPIGEPNRYAQILLVLLPLSALTFRTERSSVLRTLSLFAAALILAGLLLTFSRGTLLAGLVLLAMMAYTRLLKPRQVLVSVLSVSVLVAVFAPGVIARMASLDHLRSLLLRTGYTYQAPDSSAVHRYTLNAATWHVFLDHPILGVGPGHFAEYYSIPYANRVGLIETTKKYMAHNLYLETLAETGLIGLACLLAILFVIMRGLWKERRRLLQSRPEFASWPTAFFLCLSAYAMSAVFNHLSYQRYFWLLVALSSSTARIVHSMGQEKDIGESFSLQSERP
jgi:putative inorganic carbon (hco3(-)) transporter